MNKTLTSIILSIFLISLASASFTSLGTFKAGEDIRLIQLCDDCTFNNITSILHPNSTVILSDIEMSKSGTEFYYLLNASYVGDSGTYKVNGFGDEGATNVIWAYDFEITPSGIVTPSILEGGLFLVLILLAFAFLGLGIFLSEPLFVFSSGVLFTLSGIYGMVYGLYDIANMYTRGLSMILILIGIFIILITAWKSLTEEREEE